MECGLCGLPVSKKPEKDGNRVPDPDFPDRWVHRRCLTPDTPEEALLREIFGDPSLLSRRRVGLAKAAARQGHEVRTERDDGHRRRWICTCGHTGAWRGHNFDTLRAESQEHLRSALTEESP